MPLTPDRITAAARRMLPTYPALAGLVGLNYLLMPEGRRAASPVFSAVDETLPLPICGSVFLAIAGIQIGALLTHRRRLYEHALGALMVWLVGLAIAFALTAILSDGSFTAWVWPAFAARACWASLISLEAGER